MSLYADAEEIWHLNNVFTGEKGNDMVNTGATFTADAALGSHAAHFDGLNDCTESTNVISIGSGSQSISFWMRTDKAAAIQVPLKNGYTTTGGNSIYDGLQVFTQAGKINVSFRCTALMDTDFILDCGAYSINTYYHTVIEVDDSANTLRGYVNNVDKGTVDLTPIDGWNMTFEKGLTLGCRLVPTPSLYFSGDIDEVVVFNRVLTSAEVNTLYTGGELTEGGKFFCSVSRFDQGNIMNEFNSRNVII